MILKEKVLVLKAFKHSEADLIVHGLNSMGAKMNFFARGAAKSRKRFPGGLLEPTHYIEVTYKVGKNSHDGDPLHSLIEVQLLREFPILRTDYARLETALHILKLANKLGQHGVVDSPDLFNLVGHGLAAAEKSLDLDKLKLHFELKVLAAQGVLPIEDNMHAWLRTSLSNHEQIEVQPRERQWLHTQVHDHMRHYLGSQNVEF